MRIQKIIVAFEGLLIYFSDRTLIGSRDSLCLVFFLYVVTAHLLMESTKTLLKMHVQYLIVVTVLCSFVCPFLCNKYVTFG